MSHILEQVLEAATSVGAWATLLSPEKSAAIRKGVIDRFTIGTMRGRIWEHLFDAKSLQHPDAWRWMKGILTADPVLMLFERDEEPLVVRFDHGSQVVPVLEESIGFEFYLTDPSLNYLLCYNHHDYLIATGTAAAWLEGLRFGGSSSDNVPPSAR